MANYNNLKATINANIKANGNEEITGPILNTVLNQAVTTLGDGWSYKGIATPSMSPGTPDSNVFYIATTAGTYTNFGSLVVAEGEVAILKYNGSWAKEVTGAATAAQVTQLGQEVKGKYDFVTATGGINYANGTNTSGSAFRRTSWIELAGAKRLRYTRGLAISTSTSSGMAFFDANQRYISGQRFVLSQSENGYRITEIDVPGNAVYARFTFWQSSVVADEPFVQDSDSVDARLNVLEDTADLQASEIDEIQAELLTELQFPVSAGAVNYSNGSDVSGSTTVRTGYIELAGIKRIVYTRGIAISTSTVIGMAFYDADRAYISGQRYVLGQPEIGYVETEIEVPENAAYARFSFWDSETYSAPYYIKIPADISIMDKKLSMVYKRISDLSGKKVSIIGDSISCFGTESQTRNNGYNAPYWIVKSVDVGTTIQSWVTWLDVYTSVDGTTPTNKTIGGVALTPAMIGTLQSFTPTSEDIGKEIGVARWASSYTTKPWWSVLIDAIGAELCNNASWSGSRIVPIPEGSPRHDAFVLSEAYSEYTLGRLAKRDDDGNVINPDIVIIYRGTNDFSAEDPEGGSGGAVVTEDLTTPDMMNFSGITDPLNFTQGYIWTIMKIREKYPSAYVVLCTLNVFKRVNYSKFPSNNGTYTLPDYNNKIREIANLMGCGLIEFDKDGITWNNCYPTYINDSSSAPLHPNTTGHRVMGEKAISDLQYALMP